ncbi:hypothetical protein GCM10018987_41430 [Streptomyces cremeus]
MRYGSNSPRRTDAAILPRDPRGDGRRVRAGASWLLAQLPAQFPAPLNCLPHRGAGRGAGRTATRSGVRVRPARNGRYSVDAALAIADAKVETSV